MPERNLVKAQKNQRAQASSKFALSTLAGFCSLVFAVLVLTMQVGCKKIGGGGFDRNILRARDTLPSVEAQPITSNPRFSNDPSDALLELNEAYQEFQGSSVETKNEASASESQASNLRIVEGSQRSYGSDERGVTLVATQPPAPSIKNSFAAAEPQANKIDRVLLGGVPLSEIEPINPAKVIAQCDHVECDCMKEKLKPVLPFAQPVQPPVLSQNVPPSELVSQPLAPLMFDETTREVQNYGEQEAKQNRLRGLRQNLNESPIVLSEKIEAQTAAEPIEVAKTQARLIQLQPTVDPNLGRAIKPRSTCLNCESFVCDGECNTASRRRDTNQLRPLVASEEIPTRDFQIQPQAPIEIKGEILPTPTPQLAVVEKVDYDEFTTEDWTEIFGPPVAPTKPLVEAKNRRTDFQPKLAVSPPVPVNQFEDLNEFLPVAQLGVVSDEQDKLELVVAEVEDEPQSWEPPEHTNFSPIPTNYVRHNDDSLRPPSPQLAATPSVAIKNAAKRGVDATFPVIDTRVEIPPPKPKVIEKIIDNTVPWSVKLAETIESVRRQRDGEHDPMARNSIEVNLRLLEVLQRQMTTVEQNRNLMPNNEAHYWQHQLDAIAVMLPATSDGVSDLDRHSTAHETLEHLRKAVERLESMAALKVSSGEFCTEISGFGKYKPFASSVFEPGQKTLVYCEVENYLSNAHVVNSESSYHTRLRGSYVVYDQQGRVVQQSEYPAVEDVARNRRRDFYMYFPIQIGELAPGDYQLELLIEDLSSNKTAALKPGMSFQVR